MDGLVSVSEKYGSTNSKDDVDFILCAKPNNNNVAQLLAALNLLGITFTVVSRENCCDEAMGYDEFSMDMAKQEVIAKFKKLIEDRKKLEETMTANAAKLADLATKMAEKINNYQGDRK